MNEADDWADQLRRTYPWFPDEVYCGPGWAPLIKDLCCRIQEFLDAHEEYRSEFYVTQCKQKYGHLMLYAFPERDEIERMIEDAGDRAIWTCETCGSPGEIGAEEVEGYGSWVTVMCVLPAGVRDSFGAGRLCSAAHSNRGERPWLERTNGLFLLSSEGWRSVWSCIGNALPGRVAFRKRSGTRPPRSRRSMA